MKIIYKRIPKKFNSGKLKSFYDKVLPGKTLKQCRNVLNKSLIIGAFDKTNLIGIGRSLDDGVYGFITDIIVNKNYRKVGVGSSIVRNLCKELLKRNIKIIHCDTDKKLTNFYKSAAKFRYNKNDVTLYLKNFKYHN